MDNMCEDNLTYGVSELAKRSNICKTCRDSIILVKKFICLRIPLHT